MKSPVFLLSLPRSGSTLLQRILTQHDDIASVSEPWFLLPIIYGQKKTGVLSEYSHRNAQLAISDLIESLPAKQNDYDAAIREMSLSIYKKLCKKNEIYFLDKTPRYHLIVKDLIRIFPNSKFIFLYRNPMDIYASTMKTWGDNSFKRHYAVKNDFEVGFNNLIEAQDILGDKCLVVNYENLVTNSTASIENICTYLNIKNNFQAENELLQLKGQLGDQEGVKKYKKIEAKSIGNWKSCFDTSFRKHVIYKYISNLDADLLLKIGYNKDELLSDIKNHKVKIRLSIKDRCHILFYKLAILLNGHLLFTDVYKWVRKKYLS